MRAARAIASTLFPAPVGPQMTGTTRTSTPAKTPLELVPGEVDNGGAAMHVVRGKTRRRERDEQRAHLGWRQRIPRLDRGLTRDRRSEPLVSRVGRGSTIAAERGERLAQAPFSVEARVRHRNAADEQRVAPKALELEAQTFEQGAVRLERVGLGGGEVKREGKQQPLRWCLAALEDAHEPLEEHALVRRVLIDEHDAVVTLEEEIRATKLDERRRFDRHRTADYGRRPACRVDRIHVVACL